MAVSKLVTVGMMENERFPEYEVSTLDEWDDWGLKVNIPKALLTRHQKALLEFNKVQKLLGEYHDKETENFLQRGGVDCRTL